MWRIYSPNKKGVIIKTTAEKFTHIDGIIGGLLDKVQYVRRLDDIAIKEGLEAGLVKREAFKHEEEIRLITHIDFIKQYNNNFI